jgi:AraC-like DNA-binding protein
MNLTTVGFTFKRFDLLHFLPAVLSFIFTYPFWSMPGDQKFLILQRMLQDGNVGPARGLLAISVLLIFGYLIYLAWINNPFVNFKDKKTHLITGLLIIWLFTSLVGAYTVYKGNINFVRNLGFMFNLSLIYLFLVGQRYPSFLKSISKDIREKKYEKSLLLNVDILGLEDEIQNLLRKEVYKEVDLNLKKMAEMLSIHTHQLSQYLNEHHAMNFNSFINEKRIQAAKILLLQKEDEPIINVAFEVGFNSISSFHEAFKRFAGMAPGDYRKHNKSIHKIHDLLDSP